MKKVEPLLTQHCNTCTHCTHSYCMVFRRPIDPKYNRCWQHSLYKPDAQPFKVDNRLEMIMKAEAQNEKKYTKGYLYEENKMRKAIREEIEKEKQRKQVSNG